MHSQRVMIKRVITEPTGSTECYGARGDEGGRPGRAGAGGTRARD